MLESIRQRSSLVICENDVHVVQANLWPKPSAQIVASRPVALRADSSQGLMHVLIELMAQSLPKRGAVGVWLADELVRFWAVQVPSSTQCLSDIQAAAEMRLQQLFDVRVADWQVAVSIRAGQTCWASAIHRPFYEQVLAALRHQGLTLTKLQPELVGVWNKWRLSLKPGHWLGIWRGQTLSLLITEGKDLSVLRHFSVPLHAHQDVQWLQHLIEREALRLNVSSPKKIRLCGQAPHHWVTLNASPVPCDMLGKTCDALSLLGVAA